MQSLKIKKMRYDEFPQRLKEIPKAPKSLQYIGNMPDFNEYKFLTVVGSRKISSYGKRVIEHLIAPLSGYKICIVSGLALGADALAHKTAIDASLPTLAFPGSGLSKKVLYPKTHFSLAQDILRHGGALISEFDFEQSAAPWTFPQRNRLMAAISDATLIIEAQEKSGTLITARLAIEYNKELMVVPGDIFSENFKGSLKFLKLGAHPVLNSDDILDILKVKKQKSKKANQETLLHLDENEIKILNALDEPADKEVLLEKSKLDFAEFSIAFSKLELKSLIKEELGKVFRI